MTFDASVAVRRDLVRLVRARPRLSALAATSRADANPGARPILLRQSHVAYQAPGRHWLPRGVSLLKVTQRERHCDGADPRLESPLVGWRGVVGPGAAILGALGIGGDVVVGANAVVLRKADGLDVVAGVPARSIRAMAAADATPARESVPR